MTAKNEHTGDMIASKAATESFRKGFDQIDWSAKTSSTVVSTKPEIPEDLQSAINLIKCIKLCVTLNTKRRVR